MWAQTKAYLVTMLRAALAIGFGIFLATVEVEGRTPWEHLQRAWKRHGWSSLEDVKSSFRSAVLSITSSEVELDHPADLREARFEGDADTTLAIQ
jgi:hypothetical protein